MNRIVLPMETYPGFRLVPDSDVVPPEPTPENLARPMLGKAKAKRSRCDQRCFLDLGEN